MRKADIILQIKEKQSFLCTGLDTEINKLPLGVSKDGEGLLQFNKNIVEATKNFSIAYKINTAFYEQYGRKGWEWMEETLSFLPSNTFNIADAKRGDIGNTSKMYAKAFFETLNFDAITVSPYMGEDSLRPFLEFENKTIICLALTSNDGHKDFQTQEYKGKKLYENVINTVCKWGNEDNIMFVVGATRSNLVQEIRSIIPKHFLLVPGVGAQGGDLEAITAAAINSEVGLIVNNSRGIIYASSNEDYAIAAESKAKEMSLKMSALLQKFVI